MEKNCRLTVVLGPTASGKTRYAVRLAGETGAEIISADSRQIYRGMDIGTGKDLCDYVYEGRPVPYHLIDIVDAGVRYDIYRYQRDFARAYNDIVSRGRQAILCGGSGLYIESVTRNYAIPDVPSNPALRARLEQYDDEYLIDMLKSLTTPHNTTDYDTRKRLIRAIEIAVYQKEHPDDTGVFRAATQSHPSTSAAVPASTSTVPLPSATVPASASHVSPLGKPDSSAVTLVRFAPEEVHYIGISVSREERNARIDRRLDARLKEGLVEEVRGLLDRGLSPDDLIYYGLEYKFVTLYLIGQMSYDEMRERLAIAIHQFAKRQMTWFRGMERRGIHIDWVEA